MIIEQKYIELLSNSLRNFKKVRNGIYNFSCPLCGDSTHSKKKARAYFLLKEQYWNFYCHNCNESHSFYKFLEMFDDLLFREYKHELFLNHNQQKPIQKIKQEKKIEKVQSSLLQNIVDLNDNHRAKIYLRKRKIPLESYKSIYWTDDFPQLVNDFFPDKYDNIWLKDGIVFKALNGLIGRTINESKYRFFKAFDESGKNYFHNELDKTYQPFVVEGPVDALFLKNSYATMNSNLSNLDIKDAIYFHDQEPRNKYVCEQIEKTINKGYNIVLLDYEYFGMDINDIILKTQIKLNELESFLIKHTYKGLKAKIAFAKWKRA